MEQHKNAPADVRAVVNFLRGSKSGLKPRTGVLNGARVDYFKGKSAIKALLTPAYSKLKAAPPVTDEASATALLSRILPFMFYARVDRGSSVSGSGSPKHLQINQDQKFNPEFHYAWFYVGSQWTTYVGGAGLVAVILAGVMFPLWPEILRLGVWYLSIGVLGLIGVFFGIAILRLIFWVITIVVAPPGIWVFPKLFADVGFFESFVPFWEWDIPPKKKSKKSKLTKSGDASADDGDAAAVADATGANGKIKSAKSSDSDLSRPASRRGARIEEVPDDED